MLNSKDINHLRPDVAKACRFFLQKAKEQGLQVIVTSTVRDDAYQAYLYEQGRTRPGSVITNQKKPSFHSDRAGLAFDIAKNVPGHEYDDASFFEKCALIAKSIDFEWGGDWKSFQDKPHFQWSGPHHEYVAKDIYAGNYPPEMIIGGGEDMEGNNPGADQFRAALEKMQQAGVINSPDYWLKVGDCVLYFKEFAINVAAKL